MPDAVSVVPDAVSVVPTAVSVVPTALRVLPDAASVVATAASVVPTAVRVVPDGASVAPTTATSTTAAVALTVAAIALVACGGGSSTKEPSAGTRVGPALAAALEAAGQARAPLPCARDDGAGAAAETLTTGSHAWKLAGHALTLDSAGDVSIGVIADAAGNPAALGKLRDALGAVDLVIALGGMGMTQAEIEATLGAITGAGYPVVAVPGDLEPATAHDAAVAALRKQGRAIVDARVVHHVTVPGGSIALLPGVLSEHRLAPGADGCGYRPADATAAFTDLAAKPGVRILATAEPPRTVVDGEPTGEVTLVPPADTVDVTLHAPADQPASTARTGRRDGAAVALTPGTSDAAIRLPARRSASAGVLVVDGKSWKWRPVDASR